MNADLDKASTENERNAVFGDYAVGARDYLCAGSRFGGAPDSVLHQSGANGLSRGERYGFIRFGSRVDMYLPVDAQAQVAIGDKVTGVRTVLARYQSKPLKLPHRLKLQALPKLLNPKSKRLPIKSAMPRNRL